MEVANALPAPLSDAQLSEAAQPHLVMGHRTKLFSLLNPSTLILDGTVSIRLKQVAGLSCSAGTLVV